MKTPHENLIEEMIEEFMRAIPDPLTSEQYKAITESMHSLSQSIIEEGVRVIGERKMYELAEIMQESEGSVEPTREEILREQVYNQALSDAQEALQALIENKHE